MIRIDRKVCRDILRITNRYDVDLFFDPDFGGFSIWHGTHPDRPEFIPSVPLHEVAGSLNRLLERGMIKKIVGSWSGGMIFQITPELLHAKAFWFDRVTKKYLAGFISGVATSVVAGLIIHFVTEWF